MLFDLTKLFKVCIVLALLVLACVTAGTVAPASLASSSIAQPNTGDKR